jgi:ABC-type transport system substrate-binding protein
VAERGDDWHRDEPLVSNGPYVVESCDDEQLVLRANPQFDGPRGNIAHVCMQFKPTAVRGTAALWEDEELDVLSNVEHLLTGAHTLAEVSPALGTSMVGFRPEGALADIRVRQALTAPLVKLMENLEDAGMMVRPARAGGLLPPAMPGHLHNVQAPVEMERAAELLAEAGYPGGEGLPAVRLAAIHPMEPMLAGLEELMGRLGVTVELDLMDQGSMVSTVDADSWISGWVADYPDPHGFFRGLLSKRHLGVLNDPTLTQLLADASASRDRDARLALFAEVDRRLVSEALMVPLSYARSVLLKRPWVHGIWSNALTSLRFDQATVDR